MTKKSVMRIFWQKEQSTNFIEYIAGLQLNVGKNEHGQQVTIRFKKNQTSKTNRI